MATNEIAKAAKLVYQGERRFELIEESVAAPRADEVVLEVHAVGICGSDVHGYAGVNARRPPGTVMGHEVVGRVAVAGEDVKLAVGTTVALWPIVACGACELCLAGAPHLCDTRRLYGCTPELAGGLATHMTVPAANAVPVPRDVPEEWGALVEPLAVGYHAVGLAREFGRRTGIIGAGPIGIAVGIAARRSGASNVVFIEPREDRRRTVLEMGFEAVHPAEAPRGLETVFECVGIRATITGALEATRPGGTIVCVGLADTEIQIPAHALVIEERSLLGSSAYTRDDFVEVANSVLTEDAGLEKLIEARIDLVEAPGAFAGYAAGEVTAIKTLVMPTRTREAP